MFLKEILCCCCTNKVEEVVEVVDVVDNKVKKNFPEIVIQEPTPLILRKESEVVLDEKKVMEEITKISTAVPNTTEAEVGEEATEIADDNNPVKKKRESTRKKSIPILDQEHRMVPVNEATESEVSEMKNSEIRGEDAAQESTSSSSAAPSSSSSSSPAPSSSLQPEMRKESAMSTSSDWSWPSVQGQVGGQEEATQSGQLGLNVPAQSRRISSLAPAEVDSPLATKVDKFTMIPHPGK